MLAIVIVIVALWATAAWLVHSRLNKAHPGPADAGAALSCSSSSNSSSSSSRSATASTATVTGAIITSKNNNTNNTSSVNTSSRVSGLFFNAGPIPSAGATAPDGVVGASSGVPPSQGSGGGSSSSSSFCLLLPPKSENGVVGEEDRDLARRQKLLRKRRRLISRLYDLNQDADEILKLYFTGSDAGSDVSSTASRERDPSASRLLGAANRRDNASGRLQAGLATLRRRSEPIRSSAPLASARPPGGRISLAEDVPRVPVVRGSDTHSVGSSDDSGIGVEYVEGGTPSLLEGLPQTPKSGAKSCPYNGVEHASHAPEWATTPDDDNSLVYEDGVLVSGSLQALIQHAVPTAVYYPDTAYLFAFLLSSRLFIKPHELLQRVCDVGFTQQGLKGNDMSTINKEKLGRFVPHMVQLLGEWSETFPYDFRDERMMGGVRTMTHRCIALEPALRRDVTQVLHNLLNKLTQLERYEEGLAKMSPPPPADFIPQPTDITEVCESPLVMAQQLTHIELEKLSYIGPEEFVQAFAKDNLDACYKDLKKTSNLESYIQWFNRLSYLVATHACTHVKKKQRVRVIEWWIEVARECFNIGNFNSLMGIIAGLNMSIVSRLKKTWSKVQSAKFSVLEHQMDPSSNFSSYRSTLKAAMWRSAGAVDDRQKIVIPFFSLLVKDLYFLNEGCASRVKISESSSSSRLPNGHINFDKFWQLAKQVTEFMAWKQVTCPFEKVPDVINYMQTTAVLTETGLALASFECEGPDNSYEKERYKSLKSDTQQPAEKTNPHD
ncbi:ras-GEF domain-containing family member 1B-like isoform X5 [Panulirus ornatus]|uniref:ras-GEF domain-containing family member 1B-like isoform X5 n=1 Tax=Panulirus ornatus TaxID=150431 RepID=UPI003A86E03E